MLPAARLPQLLGDQLVGTPRLAVFELVKNAPDADSEKVTFTLVGLGTPGHSSSSRTMHVHARFSPSVLPGSCAGWNGSYRLREQLLMHLIAFESDYGSHPGIVQLLIR